MKDEANVHFKQPMSTQYNQLIELGKDKKLIAAAEVGAAPLPDLLQAYEAHWLWFAVWGDTFINNAEWNSPEVLQTVRFEPSFPTRFHPVKENKRGEKNGKGKA